MNWKSATIIAVGFVVASFPFANAAGPMRGPVAVAARDGNAQNGESGGVYVVDAAAGTVSYCWVQLTGAGGADSYVQCIKKATPLP